AVAAMVPRLQEVLSEARQAGLPVIHVRMAITAATKSDVSREHRLRRSGADRPVCEEGTWGAEFYQIEPLPGEPVVTKRRYSAFVGTDFETLLKSRGIRSLILAGVTTDVCVESTARDAFMRDYYVVFLSDCTGLDDPQVQEATLERIGRYFGQVVTSAEVLAAWRRLPAAVPARRP
ncbi:MAG: cysteine hydrolase, partial [Chloroflexi bacterium]|nr:cysteine hydrolase [Chloroflexota bacterium]